MLCIPIVGPSLDAVHAQVLEAMEQGDLLEWRVDLFEECSIEQLKELRKKISLPLIVTLRSVAQGGRYEGGEHLAAIKRLAALHPDYMDLEYDTARVFVEEMAREFPQIKLILSYHNFKETPSDLEAIYAQMQQPFIALYKMTCTACSTLDSFRMLEFMRSHRRLWGMCMGERGSITRILGPIMGSPWTFASLSQEEQSAPGQLTVKELRSTYGVHCLSKRSAVYGLIGGTVNQSISHDTHNKVMQELEIDAVYVKMAIDHDELGDALLWAKKLGIKGLSITMPHKESILSFLDEIEAQAKAIGAVNTICFHEGRAIGYNTDGIGALDAMEKKTAVRGKRVTILGAGGAARAITYEALSRGASVLLLNRTRAKALVLAKEFNIEGGGLEDISHYDILINTTPNPVPIAHKAILPHKIVMDIHTLPQYTPFLQHAEAHGCTLVFGYEMFINQAAEQYRIWFGIDKEHTLPMFKNAALAHL